MKILSLELQNFRNYPEAVVNFADGLNVLYGQNASGKTNMLESIYLCSIFHSPRTTKDKEMILLGKDKARVKIALERKFRKHTIVLQIDAQGKKKLPWTVFPSIVRVNFWACWAWCSSLPTR